MLKAHGGLIVAFLVLAVAGCAGTSSGGLDRKCSQGLASANGQLSKLKAKGVGGSVDWTRAASLLAAAKIQQQFEKYPNCVDKVKRARFYLARAAKRK